MRLSDGQLRAWDRDGFVVIERLIDDAARAELREAYDAILSRRVAAAGDRMLGGITAEQLGDKLPPAALTALRQLATSFRRKES